MLVGLTVLGVLEVVVRRQSDTDSITANGFAAFLDNLDRESDSVLNRAAIIVGSIVDIVVQELLKQVPIRTVNFNAIESSLTCSPRRLAPFLRDIVDLVDGQCSWWVLLACDTIEPVASHGNRTGADGLLPGTERGWRGTTGVPKLREDVATLCVNGIGDLLPSGYL